MGTTLNVASLSAVPIVMQALPTEDGKPGASFEIAAATDHALGRETVTPKVDADVFYDWMARNRSHPAVMTGLLWLVDKVPTALVSPDVAEPAPEADLKTVKA